MNEDWDMCECHHYRSDHYATSTICALDDCKCEKFKYDDEAANMKREFLAAKS